MSVYDRFLKVKKTTRGLRSDSRNKRGKGGGGFSDRFTPPKGEEDPASIVLFPGDYKIELKTPKRGDTVTMEREYYVVYEHFYATKMRGVTCSAGLALEKDGDNYLVVPGNDDCVPCFHIEENDAGISRRRLCVFNGVLLGYFHLVDSDRTDNDGKPYKEWKPCRGKRCKHCNNGIEKTYGRRVYWPLGSRFVDQLLAHEAKVLSKHCKCGGELEPIGFQCADCGEILLDLDEDPLDHEEIAAYRSKPAKCPNCGLRDIPEEVPECDSCNKPTPLTMWDVSMDVIRSGEGTDTNLMVTGWKPLDDKLLKRIEERMKPFDFAGRIYKKPEPAFQAKLLSLPNPFEDGGGKRKGKVDWKNDDEDDE